MLYVENGVCVSSLFLLLLCVIGLLGEVVELSLLELPDSDSNNAGKQEKE